MHSEAWGRLNSLRSRLPHALLIAGRPGIGKFDLAMYFAQSMLCEQAGDDFAPCGKCLPCGWFLRKNHPDFRLLQPESEKEHDRASASEVASPADDAVSDKSAGKKKPSRQITIDQSRALDDFLHVGAHRRGARIVLVHPAEAMNRATANSLLKSLEEPSEGALFLLVSSEFSRLLPTIRSRCLFVPVALPEAEKCEEWLHRSGVGKDAKNWLALAGGSPFLAAQLLKEEQGLLEALLAELLKKTKFDPLGAAASLERAVKADKRRNALKRAIELMQKWLFDLFLACKGLLPRYFLAHVEVLRHCAAASSAENILAFNRKSLEYRLFCEQPVNSRLFLEEVFLNYAALFVTRRRLPCQVQ
ncbi:MAG: DNA polymerase III subunit delta' [Candidatus Accumulibacter sp.]|nr:DNA polymerase III subunit delta' [Accumulibacter sp.]